MPLYEYMVIEIHGDDSPEVFGFERFDHHPVPGETFQLHWLDGRVAHTSRVDHVDPGRLEVFVVKIDGTESSTVKTAETAAITATERLRDVGFLVKNMRDRLTREVGEQGLAVAVVIRTFDGTSVHVGLEQNILEGSNLGPLDLVEALHDAMDAFMARLPSVTHLPTGNPS
jgi:hypothetical protein